MTSQVKCN